METKHPRRFVACPATIELLRAGSSVTRVAAHLGVSRASVSSYLLGRRAVPSTLRPALRQLIGDEASASVLAAIPTPVNRGRAAA